MEKIYKHTHYLFLFILLGALGGFYPTYFRFFPAFSGVSDYVHFHAVTALLWVAILIAQPILIRYRKLEWHRLIGKASYIIVALVAVSMIMLIKLAIERGNGNLFGVGDLIYFLLFYTLAMVNTKKTAYHIRYIVISSLPFIHPGFGRLGLPSILISLVILIGLLFYEKSHKKMYRPYVIGLIAFFVIYIPFIFIIDVEVWNHFWARFL